MNALEQPEFPSIAPGFTSLERARNRGSLRTCLLERRQLDGNSFQYIDRIENRRVFAADPQTGLVMGLSHFRHPMNNLPYK